MRSLAARLLAGSALGTLLALALVLVLMDRVATRFVTGQVDQRLDATIAILASRIETDRAGGLAVAAGTALPGPDRGPGRVTWRVFGPAGSIAGAGPEFERPSPARLERVARAHPALPHESERRDPVLTLDRLEVDGASLRARVAEVTRGDATALVVVALPQAAIDDPVREALVRVGGGVAGLGVALALLALVQVRLGLRPLARLRTQVAEIGAGARERLPESQPREIAPLVAELNGLLDANRAHLDKARRHVAALAHGLKTPLATLQLALDRLDASERDGLRDLVTDIDRRVAHHLGRARAGALAGVSHASVPLAPRLADIGAVLGRIHDTRAITLEIEVEDGLALTCEAADIDEIFGGMLDNAFRFARAGVSCRATREGRRARITIADDGPGLTPDEIPLAIQPGHRIDETEPGHGFGLAIARELIELYGGSLSLTCGPGLTLVFDLPATGTARLAR